jgi:hypothetical protein
MSASKKRARRYFFVTDFAAMGITTSMIVQFGG